MRATVGEWKKEWLDTNGYTDEMEVLITDSTTDSTLDEYAPYIYEGSFAKIPVELESKKVIESCKVCDSTVPSRVGAYSLYIQEQTSAMTTFLTTWQNYENSERIGLAIETDPEIPNK